MKLKLLTIGLLFSTVFSFGQTKVGTVDSELIVGLMPETKKVLTLLSKYANRLDSTYQVKVKDYQEKLADYQKKQKDFSDNYKKIKVKELNEMDQTLRKDRSNANKLIQLKRNELMRPLYRKLKDVIGGLAKADGYTQIITTTNTEFAYIDLTYDLTEKVMKKLGIEIPKENK